MNAAELLAHASSIAHGVGASLACVACFLLVGSAVVPRRWDGSLGGGESPAVIGAALYVLLCWLGIELRIPVRTIAIGYASAVLVLVAVRHKWLATALRSRGVFSHAALGWVLGFILLYVLAYVFTMSPVTDEYLPLAWMGNVDLLTYIRYTRHLLDLEPSNVVGFEYLNFVYLQTPAVFYVLGGLSLFFGADPMSAAMPAQFALTALIAVFAARISHAVFGLSRASAVAIGCILISGPFFRYVATNYFLSTLMSTPILLYLVWTTVACHPERWLDVPLAIRFASAYALLLFIYPFLFFAGLAVQAGTAALMLAAYRQSTETGWPRPGPVDGPRPEPVEGLSWREAGRLVGRPICAALVPLGLLALALRQRLVWSADMVLDLSQPGVGGWPLDLISPLAVLGLPGTLARGGQVDDAANRVWAIGVFCAVVLMLGLLYFWRFRHRTTPAQRTFVALTGAAFLSYCVYFAVLGPSYQQWKFASYSALWLSFVVFAAGLHLCHQSAAFSRAWRALWGRRLMTALAVIGGVALVGGNLLAHALTDPDPLRFPGTLRNVTMVDELPFFREMSLEMVDYPHDYPTRLALYFLPSKRVHVVSSVFDPNEPLSLEQISRERPHLIHNYGCEGVGHDDTITVPGVGCLLLAPPSLALDTVYPFNLSFLFVEPWRMGQREPEGRWNIHSTVFLDLVADPRRVRVEQDGYVNLRLKPYLTRDGTRQRVRFSWGARHAEVSLSDREWISLPVGSADWTGDALRRLSFTIDFLDAVDSWWINLPVRRDDWTGTWTVPAEVDIPDGVTARTEYWPLAVMFEEVSVSVTPRGRVATPVVEVAP